MIEDEELGEVRHLQRWSTLDRMRGSLFDGRGRRTSLTPYIGEDGHEVGVWREGSEHPRAGSRRRRCYCPGEKTFVACVALVVAVAVAALRGALVGIDWEDAGHGNGHEPFVPLSPWEVGLETTAPGGRNESALFHMATSVDEHCHAEKMGTTKGRWECQQLCRDHLCCFDADEGTAAGASRAPSAYNCRRDENKFCATFAGCEILVLGDFGGPPASDAGSAGVPASPHKGAVGDASHGDTFDEDADYEDETEWRDVRRKYVRAHCEGPSVRSEAGRRQCERVCERRFCCFDATPDGHDCREDPRMTCDLYEPCRSVLTGPTSHAAAVAAAEVVPEEAPAAIGADDAGAGAPPPLDREYTGEELRELQADTRQRCSNPGDPAGKFQCERICRPYRCCFFDVDPEETGQDANCQREDTAVMCEVYKACKVLSSLSVSLLGLNNKKEEGLDPPKVAMISPALEEESDNKYGDGFLNKNTDAIVDSANKNTDTGNNNQFNTDGSPINHNTGGGIDESVTPANSVDAMGLAMQFQEEEGTGKENEDDFYYKVYVEDSVIASSMDEGEDVPATNAENDGELYTENAVSASPVDKGEGMNTTFFDSMDIKDTTSTGFEMGEGIGKEEGDVDLPDISPDSNMDMDSVNIVTETTPKPTPQPTPKPTRNPITKPVPSQTFDQQEPSQDITVPQDPMSTFYGTNPEPNHLPAQRTTFEPTPETLPPPTAPPIVATTTTTEKPPPPPPIRCIPQGDDEVNTEVYSDDWNDDQYDRCRRWEEKHEMTVSDYWDLYGIDSASEKNLAKNMLISDPGKISNVTAKNKDDYVSKNKLTTGGFPSDDVGTFPIASKPTNKPTPTPTNKPTLKPEPPQAFDQQEISPDIDMDPDLMNTISGTNPKPTLQPTPKSTLKSTPNLLQSSTALPIVGPVKTTEKPPLPPPMRCTPQGDDEVNNEVYSDDWDDDRYDRCKRWEKKHKMTVSNYWDLYGINSTSEKNPTASMLIGDPGKISTIVSKNKDDSDGKSKLTTGGFPSGDVGALPTSDSKSKLTTGGFPSDDVGALPTSNNKSKLTTGGFPSDDVGTFLSASPGSTSLPLPPPLADSAESGGLPEDLNDVILEGADSTSKDKNNFKNEDEDIPEPLDDVVLGKDEFIDEGKLGLKDADEDIPDALDDSVFREENNLTQEATFIGKDKGNFKREDGDIPEALDDFVLADKGKVDLEGADVDIPDALDDNVLREEDN